jgi:hypothetical protein
MNTNDETSIFGQADVISSYTRAEALADGVLVSLSLAPRFGFRVPVAITAAGHGSAIAWDELVPRCREIEGMREAAVLQSAVHAAKALTRRQNAGEHVERPDRIDFSVECIATDGACRVVAVPFYMTISGGDSGEPVGTIMLIGED